MTLPPGLHANVSFDDYLRDRLCPTPSLSSSTVRTVLSQSPLHAKMHHPRYGDAHEESSRADLGTAAHAALLGGDERIVVLDADNWRTKAAKDARFAARRAGKIAILRDTSEALPAMVESARRTLAAAGINLDACRCEHTAVWCENGQWCRARPDIVAPVDYAIDYKTATNADPATWIRTSLLDGGYHIQAAWYLRALEHACPDEPTRDFLFLVGELKPPFACSLVGVSPTLLAIAQAQVEHAMEKWRACVENDLWPGYDARIHYAEAPIWYEREMAEKGIWTP